LSKDNGDTPVARERLPAVLESLLFVAGEPVQIAALARAVGWPGAKVRESLEELSVACRGRGLVVQWTGEAVQLATDPEAAPVVERFVGGDHEQPLSRGALETLAIVAFKQPISRVTIDSMRGVNSDYMIGRLRERGLIEEVGRARGPGRPLLYGTTFRFLEYFGLQRAEELALPEILAQVEDAARSAAVGQAEDDVLLALAPSVAV
jgi:segregation and condensation protein B